MLGELLSLYIGAVQNETLKNLKLILTRRK